MRPLDMAARLMALLLCSSVPAWAVDLSGRARVALNSGVDTNPRRDFVAPDNSTPIDLFGQVVANLSGGIQGERAGLGGAYDIGARKFLFLWSEDTVIQSLNLDGTLWLGGGFAVGLSGRVRDRRGAQRDYSDLAAELSLQFLPDSALDFRIAGAAHRFRFWNDISASFGGPDGTVSARYRFNKRHSLAAGGSISFRTYNAQTIPDPSQQPPPPSDTRRDFVASANLGYWYRGPVVASVSYGYFDSSSNSYGWSMRQHRVGLVFGAPLFWKLMLILDVNLRFTDYPSGIYIDSTVLTLDETGENLSSGVLKITRPLGEYFELEARYGFYYGKLPRNNYTYVRHVAALGVGFRF